MDTPAFWREVGDKPAGTQILAKTDRKRLESCYVTLIKGQESPWKAQIQSLQPAHAVSLYRPSLVWAS